MAKLEILNNVIHKNLKVITEFSEKYGSNVNCVVTFPTEFADVQREYPILFQRNPETNKYQSVVLLGIRPDENLFIDQGVWTGRYIPAILVREPFVIGFEDQTASGGDEKVPVVMVDLESPRVSKTEGEPVFLEFGGNSRYLDRINNTLQRIYQGSMIAEGMFAAFEALSLIEPVKLEITLANGEIHRLHGNFTINRDRLYALSADELAKLHSAGFLEGAFLVMNSLNNMQNLINIKNSQLK